MTVIKNTKTNMYEVRTYYKDLMGERKQKTKRGFKRKCDAQEWERQFKMKQDTDLNMSFESFVKLYLADIKPRIKYNTWLTKKYIIDEKILPYFKNRKLQDIKTVDIVQWQNTLLGYKDSKGEGYAPGYLRTINNQLTAIFNHAVNFYNLPYNPARRAGIMGNEIPKEMDFWTKEEYLKFSEAMMDKPRSFYAFEMLYWCGIRSGELLALTPADFDFEKQTVTISKTYHRSKGRDIITSPKTAKSNRTVKMPRFSVKKCRSISECSMILN